MIGIAHYEQRYKISAQGTILNLANNTLLSSILNNNGYLKIGLANGDGTQKQLLIHRLVAQHYLPNPYEYSDIKHKDGNKLNNDISNLEWCTKQQNVHHAFQTGLRKGYMSAADKELYLQDVLSGIQVKDIAEQINRHPNTLHKMLRETAKRLNLFDEWQEVMKENRNNAAIQSITAYNNRHT